MPPPLDRRAFLARAARLAGGLAAARAGLPLLDLGSARPLAVSVPAIVTRAQWGADERLRRDVPRFSPVRKFVVHHTATPASGSDPTARMRSIYLSHLNRQSEDGERWVDIGYNFVIDEWGRVYEGRYARDYPPGAVHDGEDTFLRGVRGAHAGEWNGGSVGIALIGTYDGARPTEAALDALADVIAWKCHRHGLDPTGAELWSASDGRTLPLPTIVGHRDVRATRCPGNSLYSVLPEIRARVAARLAGAAAVTQGAGPGGYRIVHETGHVTALGDATHPGDLPSQGVVTRVTAAASVPGSAAFWMLDHVGGVFGFVGAPFHGSVPGTRASGVSIGPVEAVRIAAVDAGGYWVLDRSGGVFAFGGVPFLGSVPGLRGAGLSVGEADVVAIEPTPARDGYWVLDRSGGVFAFGGAPFHGSLPALRAAGIIATEPEAVDLRAAPGGGYWVLDRSGGVFAFGGAPFHGSLPATGFLPSSRARRLVPTPSGDGYLVLTADAGVVPFGGAPFHGHGPHLNAADLVVGA